MSLMVSYPEAAIPDSVTLLRLRLMPFCAGHYLILERYKSPYIIGGNITQSDIVFAVLVCSMTYEDYIHFQYQDDYKQQIIDWGSDVGEVDVEASNEILSNYMKMGVTIPKYWVEDDVESEESGAHWIQTLLLTATGKLGYNRSEAINAPLNQIIYDALKCGQDAGSVRLMTEEEIEMSGE